VPSHLLLLLLSWRFINRSWLHKLNELIHTLSDKNGCVQEERREAWVEQERE
jgi:hypothetical protein